MVVQLESSKLSRVLVRLSDRTRDPTVLYLWLRKHRRLQLTTDFSVVRVSP